MRKKGQLFLFDQPFVPNHSDNGPLNPFRQMGLQPKILYPIDHMLDVLFCGIGLHDDDHE